jgi:hypothetical protein
VDRHDVMGVVAMVDDLMVHLVVNRRVFLGVSGGNGDGEDGDGGEAEQKLAHDALK